MLLDKNQQTFFELLRVGLWGDQGSAQVFKSSGEQDSVDWEKIYQLAHEQSVLGLVLIGIEELSPKDLELSVPKLLLLQWIGEVQVMEQRNKEMNAFIADLIEKLRKEDIYAILVKGQGIAQCYEKPLWRSCGDVDLLLGIKEYERAKNVLIPIASNVEPEYSSFMHLGMTIDGWIVELHGTMHSRLSIRIDKGVDEVQNYVFKKGKVRVWQNANTPVFLPAPDEDVIFVFTHILNHFFIDGIGLRQICDWCRLLWTYRDSLNYELLESRLRRMGLMSEWKAFYNMANRYLGMPDLGSGLMAYDSQYDKKADRIMEFVLETGNFGHNQKRKHTDSFVIQKSQALCRKTKIFYHHLMLFPCDSIKYFCHFLINGLVVAIRR